MIPSTPQLHFVALWGLALTALFKGFCARLWRINCVLFSGANNLVHSGNPYGNCNPWMHSGKTIVKIGANYSFEDNNIDDWDIDFIKTVAL